MKNSEDSVVSLSFTFSFEIIPTTTASSIVVAFYNINALRSLGVSYLLPL